MTSSAQRHVDFLTLMLRAHKDDYTADREELEATEGANLEKQQKGR